MKLGIIFLFIGSIITISGTIFHFQGKSTIGPESSFMYANSDWIFYGIETLVVGIIIIGLGLTLTRLQRKKSFENTN